MAKSKKLFALLLVLGLFYECFSLPLTSTVEENSDDDDDDQADNNDDDEQSDDAESGDDGGEGSGSKKDDVTNSEDDDDSDSDDSKSDDSGSKKDDTNNDESSPDDSNSDSDKDENNDEESDDSDDDKKDEQATKKAEVPSADEEELENANEEDIEEDLSANNVRAEDDGQIFKRQGGGGDEHHEHHHHDHEHDHGHHEHEHEHHHHGHHHGFIHEWGQEEGGEHHGHEGHGHHEHEHEHDHEHEHEHHQHHHGHHHDGHHHHEGYGWGRSDLPMAYHCRDMISKNGDNKAVTKRFCVPIGYHNNYEIQYFHGYPGNMASHMYPAPRNLQRDHIEQARKKQTVHVGYGYASGDNYRIGSAEDGMGDLRTTCESAQICADIDKDNFEEPQGHLRKSLIPFLGKTSQRDHIERATKKQTVHVGYGYASGDNYRLGYQAGGMGGLSSKFSNDGISSAPDFDHGIDGHDINNKKSDIEMPLFRKQLGSSTMRMACFAPMNCNGEFNVGGHSNMPYGHPVTHPGFTTMGYPGTALASQDVRNKINHPKVKRQLFNGDPQGMFSPQQQSPFGLPRGAEFQNQMDPPPGPGFPSMMSQGGEPAENMPMGMNQEEMGGAMRSDMSRFQSPNGFMPLAHE